MEGKGVRSGVLIYRSSEESWPKELIVQMVGRKRETLEYIVVYYQGEIEDHDLMNSWKPVCLMLLNAHARYHTYIGKLREGTAEGFWYLSTSRIVLE